MEEIKRLINWSYSRNFWTSCPSICFKRNVIPIIILFSVLCTVFLNSDLKEQAVISSGRQKNVRLNRPVTVVTAYYDIPSKRKNSSYYKWMRNFLMIIPCYLYIYTEERLLPLMKNLRHSFSDRTKIIVRPFAKLKMAQKGNLWKEQKEIDQEKYHTPEVYVVWNEKVKFVADAMRDNAFDSDYFMWTDIGCFRDTNKAKNLTTYPDTKIMNQVLGTSKVYFLKMAPFSAEDNVIESFGLPHHDFQNETRVAATIFGGHRLAMEKYNKVYYETMDLMKKHNRFIGKEQTVMAAVAVMYPQLHCLISPQQYLQDGDPWFYSAYYFSKHSETDNETQSC